MNSVNSHVTNCENMFLNYDNGINKIRQMTTDTTANCVEAEKEKERASTLSNNLKLYLHTKKYGINLTT